MKKVKPTDLPADERLALVQALSDLGCKPVRGTPVGPGPHGKTPLTITEADVASGDQTRWGGWTHAGPNEADNWEIPVRDCDALEGKDPERDPAVLVRSADVLTKAKSALKKAVPKAASTVAATAAESKATT